MWWTLIAFLLLVQITPALADEIPLVDHVDEDEQVLSLQNEISDLQTQIHLAEQQLEDQPDVAPEHP